MCRNRLTAPFWPQGAILERHGVLIYENVVFRIFAEQEPPDAGFVPPGARILILGARNRPI